MLGGVAAVRVLRFRFPYVKIVFYFFKFRRPLVVRKKRKRLRRRPLRLLFFFAVAFKLFIPAVKVACIFVVYVSLFRARFKSGIIVRFFLRPLGKVYVFIFVFIVRKLRFSLIIGKLRFPLLRLFFIFAYFRCGYSSFLLLCGSVCSYDILIPVKFPRR